MISVGVRSWADKLLREDSGQDLVEYAMLLAFISLVCMVGLRNLGIAVNTTYNTVSTSLTDSLGSGS